MTHDQSYWVVEEAIWVQGHGIMIPCTYVLYSEKLDKPYARSEQLVEEKVLKWELQ